MSKLSMIRAAAMAGMVCAGGVLAVPPAVSNVTLTQRPGTWLVDVEYETDGLGIATFQFKTNGVEICHAEAVRTVTGDISQLTPAGFHRFVWDAGRDAPEQVFSNLTVEVTLWAADDPPTYCAVCLVEEPDGLCHTYWYGKESEVPFGATNSWWKKDWLLMRKIPSTGGGYTQIGSPANEPGRTAARENIRNVRITKAFYMGIYPVTQRQWQLVNGDRPFYYNNADCGEERPAEYMTYDTIRGAAGDGYDWPGTGHAVEPSSFMGKFREKVGGVLAFDLPTEAQWEYACRAGTSGAWNNGTTIVSADTAVPDANLDLLGRYPLNGGQVWNEETAAYANPPKACTDENATAKVGSYLPNAWGLHDMHGNVWEWCLDWFANASDPALSGDDPPGPLTGTVRTDRGGAATYGGAVDCRSARRGTAAPNTRYAYMGFRVAAPAELMLGN